jgi:hypothetical protein
MKVEYASKSRKQDFPAFGAILVLNIEYFILEMGLK